MWLSGSSTREKIGFSFEMVWACAWQTGDDSLHDKLKHWKCKVSKGLLVKTWKQVEVTYTRLCGDGALSAKKGWVELIRKAVKMELFEKRLGTYLELSSINGLICYDENEFVLG